MSYGDRWDQNKAAERLGAGIKGQSADGTFTASHFPKYRGSPDDGTLTDAGVPVSDLLTSTGAGGTTPGLSAGSSTSGSCVGQVPRGVVDGVNTRFSLDYNLLNWFTVLNIGDRIQLPGVQLDPNNQPAGVMGVPGGEYQVELGKNYLVVAHPPQPGQEFYIDYWRADPAVAGVSAVLTVTSSYAPDVTADPTAAISVYGTSFSFGHLPQKSSNSPWSKTTETFDVTSTLLPVQLTDPLGIQALNVYFFTEFGSNGTGFNSYLDIYDVFLTVSYADSSTQVFRPTTTTAPDNASIATMVESPPTSSSAYAIDSDLSTYAQYHATAWGTLASPTAFILGGFTPTSSTPALTPVPLPTGNPINTTSGSTTDLAPSDSGSAVVILGGSSASTVNLPPAIAAPSAPTLSQTAGGSIAATTYYVEITYVNASGETVASAESSLAVSASHLLSIASPTSVTGATGYNVYVGTASGSETKQNFTPISIGTNWTQPTTGLTTGPVAPAENTASPGPGFTSTVVNGGTGTITIQARAGTSLNGTSAGTVLLQPGQTGTVFFNPDTNNFTIATTGGTGSGGSPATPVLGSDGTPLTDPASGEWIYNA